MVGVFGINTKREQVTVLEFDLVVVQIFPGQRAETNFCFVLCIVSQHGFYSNPFHNKSTTTKPSLQYAYLNLRRST
jgi:hypothetical protein